MTPPNDDELSPAERAALDAWSPAGPPPGFPDRVLAARAAAPTAAPRRGWRHPAVVVGATAALAAAVTGVVVTAALRPASVDHAASGALTATTRTTRSLGDRAVAVAEPSAALSWRIDPRGAATIEQRTGSVFYRVDRGGPFVVHTPAGDVRVTGTCFRIEVPPMNKSALLSGVVGAALAAGVVVTVYEGHVIAETRTGARAELPAGTRATLGPDGRVLAGPAELAAPAPPLDAVAVAALATADEKGATREELLARTVAQRAELAKVRARLVELERGGGEHGGPDAAPEPGRRWFDPSPERLAAWAAECRIRSDEPGFGGWQPSDSLGQNPRGLEPGELAAYNAALTEVQAGWKALLRALYLEATNDVAGADTLSLDAMRNEIQQKGLPGEYQRVIQAVAMERAGQAQPPADLARATPFERMMRAYLALGDQTEAALVKRVGAERAKEIRGDGWDTRSEWAGCPD